MKCWYCKTEHFRTHLDCWPGTFPGRTPKPIDYTWRCGEYYVVGEGFKYTCKRAREHNIELQKLMLD